MKCHLCRDKNCYRNEKLCAESGLFSSLPPSDLKILKIASVIEKEFYCKFTRIEEIIEFSKRLSFKKIGLAFCIGLSKETKIVADIFESHGFDVVSAVCKIGSLDKKNLDIPKLSDGYEAICNPVLQAEILNGAKTDLNVIVGLCIGHDILFQKYSDAPATVLIVKDRVLAHNPAGAIYSPYHLRRILKD